MDVAWLEASDTKPFQALYGTKTNSRGPRPLPPAEEDPELCKDPKIDAMFNTKDGEIIAFKGTYTRTENNNLSSRKNARDIKGGKNIEILSWNFQENITGN